MQTESNKEVATKPQPPPPKATLTPLDVANYVHASHGIDCPFCGSDQLDGGPVTIESPHGCQDVSCLDCGREWTDHYDLARISVDGEVISPADTSDGLAKAKGQP